MGPLGADKPYQEAGDVGLLRYAGGTLWRCAVSPGTTTEAIKR